MLIGGSLLVSPAATWAQQAPAAPPPPPLRVFLDCYECDTEYLRQNVLFVDYMRDRTDADLHILVTTQGTGGGGTSWTFKIIGLGRFQSVDRTVAFSTPSTFTSDERRKEFTRQFRLSVSGYAADTVVARDLDVTFRPPTTAALTPAKDKWNFWVFRMNGNGSLNGEKLNKSHSYRGSHSATRVTAALKMNVSASSSVNESRFTLSDGRVITSRSDSWGVGGTVVKSLGPKFSAGVRTNAGHSSFSNQEQSVIVYPGVEYNFFPYADYQRRKFTIWYELGAGYYRYKEVTIFDKLKQTVPKHLMDVSYRVRQPWGSMSIFTGMSQHLRDLKKYNISINGDAEVRLFKGFSFSVYGGYSKIKDQISLAKGGATQEEVLLRLRQLATDYSYHVSFGFSYSFGSIFNSVVNPRFGGSNTFFFF